MSPISTRIQSLMNETRDVPGLPVARTTKDEFVNSLLALVLEWEETVELPVAEEIVEAMERGLRIMKHVKQRHKNLSSGWAVIKNGNTLLDVHMTRADALSWIEKWLQRNDEQKYYHTWELKFIVQWKPVK